MISKDEVLVGDIVQLEPGSRIPADGILVSGHHILCDESVSTGESDLIAKFPADEVMARIETSMLSSKNDPFILSGSCVVEGDGTFLATGVGIHSGMGKILMSLREDTTESPMQMELVRISGVIAKVGSG